MPDNQRYTAAEQFSEASKREYEYELNRNTNLDNKVSITLAFCGVFLLKETLPEWSMQQAQMYIGKRYTEIATYNHGINESRSKKYSQAVFLLSIAVILCLINEFDKYNFM